MIGHIPCKSGSPHGVIGSGEPSAYLRAAAGSWADASRGGDNAVSPAATTIRVRANTVISLSLRTRRTFVAASIPSRQRRALHGGNDRGLCFLSMRASCYFVRRLSRWLPSRGVANQLQRL